jgi:hypothetical protein
MKFKVLLQCSQEVKNECEYTCTSIPPYCGGNSSYYLNRSYPFYGTEWISDMFWNDQELDHVIFIFKPCYMCLAAQEVAKLSVIECQKHWNFMTQTS